MKHPPCYDTSVQSRNSSPTIEIANGRLGRRIRGREHQAEGGSGRVTRNIIVVAIEDFPACNSLHRRRRRRGAAGFDSRTCMYIMCTAMAAPSPSSYRSRSKRVPNPSNARNAALPTSAYYYYHHHYRQRSNQLWTRNAMSSRREDVLLKHRHHRNLSSRSHRDCFNS